MTNLRLPGQYDERLFAAAGISGMRGPYYNSARWYLPSIGRYMELDPEALWGGINGDFGPDWYGYAGANPLLYVDVDGYSKTSGILRGNDPWLQKLKDAARKGNDAVKALERELQQMRDAGDFDPARWDKIKAWIKMAKDGRLLKGGSFLFFIDPKVLCGPNLERCRMDLQCRDGA